METESKSDVFKKREEDVINKFIADVQDKHFLEELGPGGNWKVKEGMENEFAITEDVMDLVEDAIDTISFMESELASLREQLTREIERADVGRNLFIHCREQLKQKAEVIRELIPIAERMEAMCRRRGKGEYGYKVDSDKYKLIIEKAKKLLEPQ